MSERKQRSDAGQERGSYKEKWHDEYRSSDERKRETREEAKGWVVELLSAVARAFFDSKKS